MTELAVAIVIAILIFVFLKARSKKLSATGEQEKPVTQQSKTINEAPTSSQKEIPSDVTETLSPVTQTVHPVTAVEPTSEKVQESVPADPIYENHYIPQDSMLRRHYLAQLQVMIAELNQPGSLEQYMNDEAATEKLVESYENYKKSPAPSVQKPQDAVSPIVETVTCTANTEEKADSTAAKIPEDSMLKRHYLSALSAHIAAKFPPRPTDSALRRHYEAMLDTEIKKQLGC
jgi:hypothetical protein